MTVATHLVTADFRGFFAGARLTADVLIRDNVRGVAAATGLTPPLGYVSGGTKASVENGVLLDSSGSTGVTLTSNDAQLNLAGALQYTFEFFDVKIDGIYTPEAIPNITYNAPADSTEIDLIEQIDTSGMVGITPLPQVPSTGISDATPFSRQIITAPDAATVNSLLGDNPAMSGATVLTASTAPTAGQITRYNATGGALSPPLPALSGLSPGALYGVQKYQGDASANTVTFTAAGSDKFDDTTTTALVLKLTGELRLLQVFKVGATKFWKVVGGNTPIAALDGRYPGLVQAAKNPDLLVTGAVTVDGSDLVTSAVVAWPDGSPGTLTITSRDLNSAVLAYNVTYGSPVTKTFTQPTITRNTNGAATNVPAIVVT